MDRWMKPKLTDYWDQQVGALDMAAREISALEAGARQSALDGIAGSIKRHVDALDDDVLMQACVAITDDLYKAACATDRWDADLDAYLRASAETWSNLLSLRGLAVQYLVDNAWEDMSRPLELFPAWYGACGFVYVCPQVIALELIPKQQAHGGEPPVSVAGYLEEARGVSDQLVARCQDEQRHFFQLDTDFSESSFGAALGRQGAAGTVTIFRNEAPEPGTNVSVWYPADDGM